MRIMSVSKQCTVWINWLAQEVHCVRAAGERESHQRCHESSVPSRRWQREGQILPVSSAGCQAFVLPTSISLSCNSNKGIEQGQ